MKASTRFGSTRLRERATAYGLIGGSCAVLHAGLVIAGDRIGVHYLASGAAAFVIVAAAGYHFHARYTFYAPASLAGFARYALGMALNYPLSSALLFLFCDIAGWPVGWSAPATTVVLAGWNVVASRWAIARGRTDAAPSGTSPVLAAELAKARP